jgi:hypothetical protein
VQDPDEMTAKKIWHLPLQYSFLDVMCSVCLRSKEAITIHKFVDLYLSLIYIGIFTVKVSINNNHFRNYILGNEYCDIYCKLGRNAGILHGPLLGGTCGDFLPHHHQSTSTSYQSLQKIIIYHIIIHPLLHLISHFRR